MEQLRHLQLVILSIMKDVDELCRNNGIEYYLLGGSAIGAVRHQGFIPWDDDLDIVMNNDNFEKFVEACRTKLDTSKYHFQLGLEDWPMPLSKVRLKDTLMEEPFGYVDSSGEKGIYIDVFKLENAPSSKRAQLWHYFCAKYLLCYCLKKRGWKKTLLRNRLMMFAATPLAIRGVYRFFRNQVEKYNNKDTDYYLFWGGRYRWHSSFFRKEVLSNPIRVPFEDTMLPIPAKYNEWLSQIFGDYMTLPPLEKRKGLHLVKVDFGKY